MHIVLNLDSVPVGAGGLVQEVGESGERVI